MLRMFAVEAFEDAPVILHQNTINDYNRFKKFYNQFMPNWEKSVTTLLVSEIPQQNPTDAVPPDKDPSTVAYPKSTPPIPTRVDLNKYIDIISKDTPFPHITDAVPDEINMTILPQIISQIPNNSTPYINALILMNDSLERASSNLDQALKGSSIDAFEDKCDDISRCIDKKNITNQELISKKISNFFSNSQLEILAEKNIKLMNSVKEIQKQAENGELAGNLTNNLVLHDDDATYTMPEGGDTLSKMKKSDPGKYKQLEENKSWLSIKEMIEQINRALTK